MEKSKVYFCKEITPENVVKIYQALGKELPGKVAVKVHSGEEGNQNYLRPEFMIPMVKYVNGTIVECNAAYGGERNTTEKHLKTIERHGWNKYFDVDLLDENGPDISVPVIGGKHLKEDFLGKDIEKYDSMLVISHFKGHPMGGYGGALKQLSIGCASSEGKSWIHSAGTNKDQYTVWDNLPPQNDFLESMAEAASAVVKYFNGNMAFINVMCNMSVDCDCCAVAEDPCMKDIGILASLDPIAIDQACIDFVKKSNDPGKEHFLERVTSRNGEHTIEAAHKLGFGNREYELIEIR
ncbi:MAG: DUF362 domain-containing protein [Clostridia bacterium]|nr:DUF362 domain-containing protein [Clostridia bacterium]